MKRFALREFALLCLPLAIVAGVGWWAMRRPVPKPVAAGPQLQLSISQPTTLAAFDGVKTMLTAQVSDDAKGRSYWLDHPKVWLAIAAPQGQKLWRSDKPSPGDAAWISGDHSYADSVALKQLFEGQITYGISGPLVESGKPKPPNPIVLKQQWKIDRTKIEPFDFSLPRPW